MSFSKRTKKNITNNHQLPPKKIKRIVSNNDKEFINNLLSKNDNKNTKLISNKNNKPQTKQKLSKKNRIINNFHKAVTSTNSDDVIVKMLELKENDIINFYSNLENMIGIELTNNIKTQMNIDVKNNTHNKIVLCPFCLENKSNCVIILLVFYI